MDDKQFRQLLNWFGLSWDGYRKVRKGVKKRIRRHMQQLGCQNMEAYFLSLDKSEELRLQSERLMTVSISRFFRDRHLWKTLENRILRSIIEKKRAEPPFIIASTLLVPGYVDKHEIGAIARYIAGLNPEIPYSLLAFYPCFHLNDLPTTSRTHALTCKEAAERQGLHHVHVGNVHLLGEDY